MDGIINSMDISLSNLWETVRDREAWRATVHGVQRLKTLLLEETRPTTWLIHIVVWHKTTQHYKLIILQLKIN